MKKQIKLVAVLALCLAMCLSLAACGGDDGPTLESYLASIQSQLDAQIKAYESQGMKMEVKADGNKLVYRYQYTIDIGMSIPDAKAILDAGLDGQDATFAGVLASLKTEVPSAKAVVVEYVDMNGTLITSREWN